MSKKDWCSDKGRKARQNGMKELESKQRKIFFCALFAASFLVYLIFGSIHASRSSNAMTVSSEYEK